MKRLRFYRTHIPLWKRALRQREKQLCFVCSRRTRASSNCACSPCTEELSAFSERLRAALRVAGRFRLQKDAPAQDTQR